jgi:hypothetical protein
MYRFGLKMRDHIDLFEEKNGSITVEIDLEHYLPLFLRANGQGDPLHADEKVAFDNIYADFTNHFAGVGAEALMDDIKTYLLQKYSIEEQAEIKASPAFNLIHDAYTEICKNAIDAFLEQHMQNTNELSHTVKLNINLEIFFDQVSISFSDSGPGFTQPMRDALNTEEKQLAYSEKRQGSQKRAGGTAGFKGMMGQGGRGLRNIIALVLSGEPLQPRQKLLRAKHFDSEIHFTNDNNPYCTGACIEITTQIAPIPELNNIKGIEGSPRTASSRPDTTDSEGSHSSISTYHSEQSSIHTVSAGLSDLSLIIEDSTDEHFVGNSPEIAKSTDGLGLELSIDIDPYDTSHFNGSSPDLPKKTRSSRLSIEGHTDTSSFSESSPETPKNANASLSIESKPPMNSHQSHRSGSTADTQRFARKKNLSVTGARSSHNTAPYSDALLAPPLNVRQSWPNHASTKSTSKKQSEFKGKMQANLGQKKEPEPGKSKKSWQNKF